MTPPAIARELPQYSEDAEQAVLSAMLMDPEAALSGVRHIEEGMFYRSANRLIFRAMSSLLERGDRIDPLTLTEELSRSEDLAASGGKDYIASIMDAVPTSANIAFHAKIVREKALRRQILELSAAITAGKVPASDAGATLRWLQAELSKAEARFALDAAIELPMPIRALDVGADAPISFHAEDFMIVGDPMLIAGEDGQFKTVVALHIACATAAGGRIFGRYNVLRHGPVLIVSGEDPAGIIANRARALCRGHGWNIDRTLGQIHILELAGENLLTEAWKAHLGAVIADLKPVLIVFDPLRELTPGDEQSSNDMTPLMSTLKRLAKVSDATPLLVHHAGKGGGERRSKDRIRGSTAITSASRRTIFVEDQPNEKAVRIESIKFSRVANPPVFMLRRFIEADPDNHAKWISARFEFVSTQEVALDRAELFVRGQLADGCRMSTTDLKNAAKNTGVSGAEISQALRVLEMSRNISFEEGPKGRKDWFWLVAGNSGQPRQPEKEVARQPLSLPGNPSEDDSACPAPIGGRQASRNREASASRTEGRLL